MHNVYNKEQLHSNKRKNKRIMQKKRMRKWLVWHGKYAFTLLLLNKEFQFFFVVFLLLLWLTDYIFSLTWKFFVIKFYKAYEMVLLLVFAHKLMEERNKYTKFNLFSFKLFHLRSDLLQNGLVFWNHCENVEKAIKYIKYEVIILLFYIVYWMSS